MTKIVESFISTKYTAQIGNKMKHVTIKGMYINECFDAVLHVDVSSF